MERTILGRTGLSVSVMGLGCGGPSRIGQSLDKSEEESIRVVRESLDAGINFIDTAEGYRTEEIVGKGIAHAKRENVIISTKKTMRRNGVTISGAELVEGLEASLRRLGTDYIDIYNLHAVFPNEYAHAREELVPALFKMRDQGKIRFLGITEMFGKDTAHEMLEMALEDDCWDVMMVGFNLLNQTARKSVFPKTIEKNIGTQIMFAVRRALSRPEKLKETIADLVARGKVDAEDFNLEDPLGFLLDEDGVQSVTDAAYRYCRHEPGAHVILSGTSSLEHLRENILSLNRPDLAPETRARLDKIFARSDDVSGS